MKRLALCAALCAPRAAIAQPYPPDIVVREELPPDARAARWQERPLSVELHGGMAGPYGALGAGVEYSTGPRFAVATGVGVDAEPFGPHWGVMARIRPLILGNFASGVEAGSSIGSHERSETSCLRCERWRWELAVFGHIALYGEYRRDDGWLARMSIGATSLFNVADGECTRCGPGATPSFGVTTSPYVGVAIGWAPEL